MHLRTTVKLRICFPASHGSIKLISPSKLRNQESHEAVAFVKWPKRGSGPGDQVRGRHVDQVRRKHAAKRETVVTGSKGPAPFLQGTLGTWHLDCEVHAQESLRWAETDTAM